MTAHEIIEELRPLGLDSYKRTMMRHGVSEPLFGVKIEELKKYQKRIKKDYQLALDLYDTGVYDAMYLAGLIADDAKMTEADLRGWLARAPCAAVADFTVSWVAAGSKHGWNLAREWIESDIENEVVAGWTTLNSYVAITDDAELDLGELSRLLERVRSTVHQQSNRLRYVMNSYVIAIGCYVAPLSDLALQTAESIGKVAVELVGECKLPFAPDYIEKVRARGAVGKKRKSAKC